MKKIVLLLCVFSFTFSLNAQIKIPQPSLYSKIDQKVGLTDVTLEYSRPNMRGRTIFGDLVPYGKLWRLGANANTKITFSDDVKIDDNLLKAGSYAIYATPNEESWDVVFYSDASNWGIPQNWEDSKVAAKVTAKVYEMPVDIESFTITFDNLASNSAVIGMLWEKVYVGVKFEVPTDDKVSKAIDKMLNSSPSADDYYSAAVYYSREEKDLKKASEWMEKAMAMTKEPRFWQLRQQSLIYAKIGDREKAIETAKKSLEGAKKSKNEDYIKMNIDSLKEWGAL